MRLLLITCLSLFSFNVFADWTLDLTQSSINFDTTKKETVTETHSFSDFNATVQDNGLAKLSINTASVDTNIGIRDQRLRDLFFKTTEFPNALVTLSVPTKHLKQTTKNVTLTTKAEIELVGMMIEQDVSLEIHYMKDNTVKVTSTEPVVLNVESFKLTEGLNTLKNLAGLSSISFEVPVSFSLTFKKS